jgi:hypothetical protein
VDKEPKTALFFNAKAQRRKGRNRKQLSHRGGAEKCGGRKGKLLNYLGIWNNRYECCKLFMCSNLGVYDFANFGGLEEVVLRCVRFPIRAFGNEKMRWSLFFKRGADAWGDGD